MSIMEAIRLRRALAQLPTEQAPPEHRPEMLYIGCIDARLDPIDDIGIPKGKALIFRNIGAVVLGDMPESAELQNASIGAVLEFFIRHIPAPGGRKKHIVVSGHTDCGGMKACRHGVSQADPYLTRYLAGLSGIRASVLEKAKIEGWDESQILAALERDSVSQSMRNLLTYPVVQEAVTQNRLETHGWVIDTANSRIWELDSQTGQFAPMHARPE